MLTDTEQETRWQWPRYNPPGLLVGPLLYIKGPTGCFVPDWTRQGVAERVEIEISFWLDMERYRE